MLIASLGVTFALLKAFYLIHKGFFLTHPLTYFKCPNFLINLSRPMYGKEITDSIKSWNCGVHKDRDGEHGLEDVEFTSGKVYRPYTEELWAGVEKLREAITQMNARIVELISTNEGIARIVSGGQLMLGGGDDD